MADKDSNYTTMASTPGFGYLTPAEPILSENDRTSSLPSALLTAAETGEASLAVIFGGQSTANPNCVDQAAELYSTYQPLVEPLVAANDVLL